MERHEGAESRVPCQFPSVKVHLDSGSFHRSEPEIDSTSITVSESVVFFFGGGEMRNVLITPKRRRNNANFQRGCIGCDTEMIGGGVRSKDAQVYVIYHILIFPRRISGVREKGKRLRLKLHRPHPNRIFGVCL